MTRRRILRAGTPAPAGVPHALDCECGTCRRRGRRRSKVGGRRAGAGRKPVTGVARNLSERYYVTPAESLEIHLAIEIAQRNHSDVARELMLDWARRLRAPT